MMIALFPWEILTFITSQKDFCYLHCLPVLLKKSTFYKAPVKPSYTDLSLTNLPNYFSNSRQDNCYPSQHLPAQS